MADKNSIKTELLNSTQFFFCFTRKNIPTLKSSCSKITKLTSYHVSQNDECARAINHHGVRKCFQ